MDRAASTKRDVLERMLLDESVEPTDLPLSLLEYITNGFSDDKRIGRGGFAVVYKGILRNGTVAVKKLLFNTQLHESKFIQEVECLMKAKHKNVVRFLGYCADTQGKVESYNGKFVMADVPQKLLCFEYLPKGSLHDYITDASHELEWTQCYQIIKGICAGLHYLHENCIVHLDLKPTNILFDNNVVPKIADFGLSRCFDERQSHVITSKLYGTLGYIAPEVIHCGRITFKSDMYSLGVIILEILKTGTEDYDVLERWGNRLDKIHREKQLEQLRVCAEIGKECTDYDPKRRPDARDVVRRLDEADIVDGYIVDVVRRASYEYRPEKRLRELREDPQNMVKQLLTKCAEALSEERIDEFLSLVQQARGVVSITGEPIQRLGAYLLEGLVARHANSGTNIYRALKCREPESNELLSYMKILYNICPYFKFGYMAANGAIAEALRNEYNIHIIDFQIAQGTQWITLIQALAARPGGPPHVRITGIDDPVSEYARGEGLDLVGKMLKSMSEEFRIPLEFTPLPGIYATQVTKEMLDIRPGEALAVNFTLQLHRTPDESVDVNYPRNGLLRMVKGLSPKVTTLVEQESHTNTTPFLMRFTETLDYYSAMFESIDANLPRENKERINVEQHCLAKDIVNIIACEGKDRVERHELLGKWRSRLTKAGFRPYPLSSYVNSVIRKLLACYSYKYTLEEKDGAMLLGWKNRKLISASAWH